MTVAYDGIGREGGGGVIIQFQWQFGVVVAGHVTLAAHVPFSVAVGGGDYDSVG